MGIARIFTSPFDFEANIIKHVLERHGFHPRLESSGSAAVVGVSPYVVPVGIVVPESEAEEALALLARMTRRDEHGRLTVVDPSTGGELTDTPGPGALSGPHDASEPEPEVCPECGEEWEPGFDVCWSCEWERP